MGKKRNKATKKKQAAAKKKRLSSTYGVSVLKGGTTHSSKQNNHANASIGIDGKQGKKGGSVPNNREGNTKHITDNALLQQQPGKKRSRNSNDEDDFNHQYASLEERSLALTARKAELQKKKKGNRRQQKKKGWGSKFAGPSSSTTTIPKFAPATLSLAPKSTQQLVDDAANEVARGMNEIGSSSNHQQSMMVTNPILGGTVSSTAIPGQSSLAAAASYNWKLRVSNISDNQTQQQQAAQSQNNPYAALDTDSDDDSDNEWSDKKKQKVVQQFQFKPASFSFQSSATTTNSSTVSNNIPQMMGPSVEGNDIDPDL